MEMADALIEMSQASGGKKRCGSPLFIEKYFGDNIFNCCVPGFIF